MAESNPAPVFTESRALDFELDRDLDRKLHQDLDCDLDMDGDLGLATLNMHQGPDYLGADYHPGEDYPGCAEEGSKVSAPSAGSEFSSHQTTPVTSQQAAPQGPGPSTTLDRDNNPDVASCPSQPPPDYSCPGGNTTTPTVQQPALGSTHTPSTVATAAAGAAAGAASIRGVAKPSVTRAAPESGHYHGSRSSPDTRARTSKPEAGSKDGFGNWPGWIGHKRGWVPVCEGVEMEEEVGQTGGTAGRKSVDGQLGAGVSAFSFASTRERVVGWGRGVGVWKACSRESQQTTMDCYRL